MFYNRGYLSGRRRAPGALAVVAAFALALLPACSPGGNVQETLTVPPINTAVPQDNATQAPDSLPTTQAAPETETTAPQPATAPAESTSTIQPPDEPIPASGSVTTFPDGGAYQWAPFLSGLTEPTDLEDPGDGSGRLFVLEQPGRIRVVENGSLLPDPYLDITSQVGSQSSEQGLLGLAFHPEYASNGLFFINYTDREGDSVVSQWSVSADTTRADPGSEQVLLRVAQPFPNHNGGGVVFGPDGFLYLSFGDGGSGGDPQGNGQSLDTLLGKILRIDPDLNGSYNIPADNPFASGGGVAEIWLYGLRNPWRFSFDKASADLFIADVGQNQWEEIDFLPAGSPGGGNFGWNFREGSHPFEGQPPAGMDLLDPVYEYSHADGCSVTGGYVYRGQALPDWQGIYVFGDYCSGRVWGLLQAEGGWQAQALMETGVRISSFGQDAAGEVYLLSHGEGQVYRLQAR